MIDHQQIKRTSKFLSLVLRHRPETIGITLDPEGWVDVDDLLTSLRKSNRPMTREELEFVVDSNDKQRFAFSEDGFRMRANQGHSIDVALGYDPSEPPEILLHGTSSQFVDTILREGLKKMKRHHVHLHTDAEIASAVGQRRGKSVMLNIRSGEMFRQGFKFMVTPNNVWLTDQVPPEFIDRT